MPLGERFSDKWRRRNQNLHLSERNITVIMAKLLYALELLHKSLKICHHDIHDENVLVHGDGHVLLADFGMCEKIEKPTQIQYDFSQLNGIYLSLSLKEPDQILLKLLQNQNNISQFDEIKSIIFLMKSIGRKSNIRPSISHLIRFFKYCFIEFVFYGLKRNILCVIVIS